MTEFYNYDNPCILAALHPARSFADASARTSENSGSNALVNNSAYIHRVKECEKRIDFEEKKPVDVFLWVVFHLDKNK